VNIRPGILADKYAFKLCKAINDDIKRIEPVIEIVPAETKHLRMIADKLREEDKREILGFGITPNKALWIS